MVSSGSSASHSKPRICGAGRRGWLLENQARGETAPEGTNATGPIFDHGTLWLFIGQPISSSSA